MQVEKLVECYPRLYHMAERGTWESIRARGLLSTTAVLDLMGLRGSKRHRYEAQQRRDMETILQGHPDAIMLRDQLPMPPDRLQTALIDGTTPEDWYRLINGKVFFWAERKRLTTLLKARAYRNKEHDVLTIDTQSLMNAHENRAWLCRMNSGNTWPFPLPRGRGDFMRIAQYPATKKGAPAKKVVEVLIDYSVPDIATHVVAVDVMKGEEILNELWRR
jgi:hypothetical protein